jgi:hypothetical protein
MSGRLTALVLEGHRRRYIEAFEAAAAPSPPRRSRPDRR